MRIRVQNRHLVPILRIGAHGRDHRMGASDEAREPHRTGQPNVAPLAQSCLPGATL